MILSVEQFIEKLRKAPEWAIGLERDILVLLVWENGTMKRYQGPDPLSFETELEYVRFVDKVSKIVDEPEVQKKRLA
jgi:hypothetical protein